MIKLTIASRILTTLAVMVKTPSLTNKLYPPSAKRQTGSIPLGLGFEALASVFGYVGPSTSKTPALKKKFYLSLKFI
ncbi:MULTISPECIES: hypothetical protein [Carboxydothermus]|uniref:hypothetical protein n=1 Tax=Carboxydothermus TaxID=129957 RepID=UPI001178B8ED|nr:MULTISPECIES: hypothetical protein [Carboxydothermus]